MKSNQRTLEERVQRIRELLEKVDEGNAWEIGAEVNEIERYRLAWGAGYRGTRDCLKQQIRNYKSRTVDRYARVAKYFSKETTVEFGVRRLDALITHQLRVYRRVTGLLDCEIQVPQENGSLVTKKFKDCRVREITRNPRKNRKTNYSPAPQTPDRPVSLVRRLFGSFGKLIGRSKPSKR
jgi:hypothetical protein